MGFKFNLKKAKSNPDSVAAPIDKTRTPLSQAHHDWSDKTIASWNDHTDFIERTKLTGIHPPQRGGTITGLIVKDKRRGQWAERVGRLGMILVIPVTAGAVFYYLNSDDNVIEGQAHQASVTTSPVPETKAPVASAPVPAKDPVANTVSDLIVITSRPYSIGAADSLYRPTAATPAHPLVKISSAPPRENQLLAIDRNAPSTGLSRDELTALSKWVARDESAKRIADELRVTSRAQAGRGCHPVTQFRFTTDAERNESQLARDEIGHISSLWLSALTWGEQDVAEQLRLWLLSWARRYKPVGDIYSDAELASMIETIPSLIGRFTTEERQLLDEWLYLMADRQATEALLRPVQNDRWYAHHLKMMTLIGYATGNENIQGYVKTNFGAHVASSILPDGSVTTFAQTGSIELSIDHLTQLIRAAQILYRVGRADADSLPLPHSLLGKAFDFVFPYILGRVEHQEFLTPKDPLISQRQALRDISVATRAFDPKTGIPLLETMIFFRPALMRELAIVAGRERDRFPTPRSLLYDSMSRDVDAFEPAPPTPTKSPLPASVPPTTK